MKLKSMKLVAACLIVTLLLVPAMRVYAAEPAARTLSVFRVDGDDAFLARALGGRGVEPREGQRLSQGNVMQTGHDTQVYMQLDAASIVKQDELTYVAVSAAGNLLSLSVLRGSALVDVAEMEPGHRLETRIGSTVMSVRGTIFTAAIREGGATVITMLSGYGAVLVAGAEQEVPLTQGYVFWAFDDEAEFDVRPLDVNAMSLFELQETWNYREHLLEIGTITPAMQAQLPGLINSRQTERDSRRQAQLSAFADVHAQAAQATGFAQVDEPAPAFDISNLVWIVEPNLLHEAVTLCHCGVFINEYWMIVNRQSGQLTGTAHFGHGWYMPLYVFDRERSLFGHSGFGQGYFNLLGVFPAAEAHQRFAEVRNRLLVVENVDSTLRRHWGARNWDLDHDSAFSGSFAVMFNGQLVTDFVFNDRGRFFGDRGINAIAVRRGAFWGLIDQHGNEATPFIFEHIVPIDNNTAFARIGGRYGILDIRASN